MTHFWAKTTRAGEPDVSVYEHLINVGCTAWCIAETCPKLLLRFHLTARTVGFLAALHDLGKITPGFQRKCKKWLVKNGLLEIDSVNRWDALMESDHGKVTQEAVQEYLVQSQVPRKTGKYLAAVLGAHHGRIKVLPSDRGIAQYIKRISEDKSDIDWNAARMDCARHAWSFFCQQESVPELTDKTSASWWLAGLTSVADWIGSDERFFPSDKHVGDAAYKHARYALSEIGLLPPSIIPSLTFLDLFGFSPNEMQQSALQAITEPGVYIIEAPMGLGKTEAALGAAYELLTASKARGIYFALPTQATSNRIYLRFNEYLRRITPEASSSRLIHGNSWLMDNRPPLQPATTIQEDEPTADARNGRDWFSSSKRALIAPFGVGTVDQALLGVVAAKHFFVRRFALAGKVVILDEIHSYDLYTGTLINELITTLSGLGCTIIILSATLTCKRRSELLCLPETESDDDRKNDQPYPLLSGCTETGLIVHLAASPPAPREILVDFLAVGDAQQQAVILANNGGSVLCICNTVEAAQKQYQRLQEAVANTFPVGLLHARFPYWRREQLESEWMERFGKDSITRCGAILVATQVVEQSVDLDADLLLTELAPTDLLLQRIGRLWRHERGFRQVDAPRVCIIEETATLEDMRFMDAKSIVACLGTKAKVYAPYVLLRSLEIWRGMTTITLPTQIRDLIEATYADRYDDPTAWIELYDEWFATDSAKKMIAIRNTNLWQPSLEDDEGVQTRLNEMPTVALVLCRNLTKTSAVFVDGSNAVLGGEEYLLATAQAVHKNLVRIPEHCFDNVVSCKEFKRYLFGRQCSGIVLPDGLVQTSGTRPGIRLFYTDEHGLVIEKSPQRRGA